MSRRLLQQFVWYGKKNSPIINSETLEIFIKNLVKKPTVYHLHLYLPNFHSILFWEYSVVSQILTFEALPPPLLPSIIVVFWSIIRILTPAPNILPLLFIVVTYIMVSPRLQRTTRRVKGNIKINFRFGIRK